MVARNAMISTILEIVLLSIQFGFIAFAIGPDEGTPLLVASSLLPLLDIVVLSTFFNPHRCQLLAWLLLANDSNRFVGQIAF
jgi:hypothetical protein